MSDGANDDDDPSRVVTAFLRNDGTVLLLRRSDAVGTDAARWSGVSGLAEGDPDAAVRREIEAETGLVDRVSLVRSGRPVRAGDPDLGCERIVHPYLFDCEARDVDAGEERDAHEWVPPTAILEPERATVPELWTTYERVAPTVRSIAADDEHGAAYLSVRALEVLRDRAGTLVAEREEIGPDPAGERTELADLARRLLEARPSMAVLRNRVNRAMAESAERETEGDAAGDEAGASGTGSDESDAGGAPAVLAAAIDGIDRAVAADDAAAARASEYATGRVLTLSRSGTVLEALQKGDPERVFVAESRPAREGVDVAEELAADRPVTLHTDAAAAHLLAREDVDAVLVGADTVLPDGRVVNKTGTRGVAIAARREGVPVYAVAASDKVSTRETVNLESGDRSAVYDDEAPLDVTNPTFDVTPADPVTGIVTEDGTIAPGEVESVAERLRELEDWRDG